MTTQPAADGASIEFSDARGHAWRAVWYAPEPPAPSGTPHGASAVCFTAEGLAVVVSTGARWEFPGGRPEPGEDPRTTLEREVLEEACARVVEATRVGVVRSECLQGPQAGVVLVRSLWSALVSLQPWEPQHEMTERRLMPARAALAWLRVPPGMLPIYERWLLEAIAARER